MATGAILENERHIGRIGTGVDYCRPGRCDCDCVRRSGSGTHSEKNALDASAATLKIDLQQAETDANDTKDSLLQVKGEIDHRFFCMTT